MEGNSNILVLSCGSRNKIIQYFKKELNGRGKVFATDCSELAPALYDADQHFIVPRMTDEGYLDVILNICKEHKIKAVLTLIDPEISLLAEHKEKFLEVGTLPIVSDYETVELCFDKYKMYQYLVQQGFSTVKSYINTTDFYKALENGEVNYPVFVKPVKGSASINISKIDTQEDIELLFNKYDNLMIQEFMDGQEYGADVYIDMISGEIVDIFIKEKLKMRAGETDKSVSMKDERLFSLIEDFVKQANFKGVIDIDIFKVKDEYYISEVNPRFGGGYPHAYECNVNFMKRILRNIGNLQNERSVHKYEKNVYMMKYSEVKIFKGQQ